VHENRGGRGDALHKKAPSVRSTVMHNVTRSDMSPVTREIRDDALSLQGVMHDTGGRC
jgi:hypothetical protein